MKNTILSLILFCCCLAGVAQEPIEVMVLMKAHHDRTQLCRQAEFYPTRVARRDYVVKELKAFAEASQQDLMATLKELEQQDLVSSIHSLWSANALYFTTTEQVVQTLAERPDIKSITPVKQYQWIPEAEMTTDTPSAIETKAASPYNVLANIRQVHADQVWEKGYMGQGVVIAVVDSGVNYHHFDLADHLWDGGEAFPNHGYDIVNDDDDPIDDLGHGTHCAGTVCGDGTTGYVTGAAPEATLMIVKSINNEGFGGAVNITRGMEWAVEHGCDAISMSLGMANAEIADKELFRHTCEALLDAGVAAIVCTGNERNLQHIIPIPNNVRVPASCPPPSLDREQMANPGGLSCVIAVGAVDENDTVATFTSEGPVTWQDTEFGDYAYEPGIGLIRPDVSAPGVNIWSLSYYDNGGYDIMSGTSQAVPCVAGIVALMLNKNPELSPAEIFSILEETSLRLTPRKSNLTGKGRVDALAAVDAVPEWDAVEEHSDLLVDDLDASDAALQVIDMNGRVVLTCKDARSNLTESLPPGIYVLRLINDHQVKTRKIVIR